MSGKKKYPISQKVSLTLFDKTVSTEEELTSILDEKFIECVLGRISFIIRTVSPEDMSIDTPDLEITGTPILGISKEGDGINLIIESEGMESVTDKNLDELELVHLCHYLEKRYVVPSARFCPLDPFKETQDEFHKEKDESQNLPREIIEMVYNICLSANKGDTNDVFVEILTAAASIIAMNEDPEEALQTFVHATRHISEDDDSSFANLAERNNLLS